MLPNTLTDRELVNFSERYILTGGLPSDFQRELLLRFEEKLNNIDNGEYAEDTSDLHDEIGSLQDEVYELERENSDLQDKIDELQEQLDAK